MSSEKKPNRRDFLKQSIGLLVVSTAGGTALYGRILPKSYKRVNANQVAATYSIKVSDFPTQTLPNGIKIGLTEVGSSIKLTTFEELQMNPDHCQRSGRDGVNYPISIVRVKESGDDAFTAVSTWCPHNNKSQLAYFNHQLGDDGLFVCTEHEFSCFKADGTWVPPEDSPYPDDAPDKEDFVLNTNPDGTPYLTRFGVSFDGEDTIILSDILCECEPCPDDASVEEGTSDSFRLEQNVPNPVRNSTVFAFELPSAADVMLKVISTAGEEMAVVFAGMLEGGRHLVDFDAKKLAAGTYFYKLESRFGVQTRRMIVVR